MSHFDLRSIFFGPIFVLDKWEHILDHWAKLLDNNRLSGFLDY